MSGKSTDYFLGDDKNIDMYLVILRYFDGKIENLSEGVIKKLKKGKDKDGNVIEPIDKKIIKQLNKILKFKNENPEVYANINFIYPEWSDDEIQTKLKEKFPNDYEDEEKEDETETVEEIKEGEDIEEIIDIETSIIPQRKAFIEWVNDVFYKKILEDHKENKDTMNDIKIYQYFVSRYLKIEFPFRGLLVYHGLGTGKTATSVVTAEGLSKNMPIYTLLPASLETEYIKEVKSWGDSLFNIKKNNWIFYSIDEINSNTKLRKELFKKYGIDSSHINNVFNKTKNIISSKIDKDDPEYKEKISKIVRRLNNVKGVYFPSESISEEYRNIYTVTGEPILEEGEKYEPSEGNECKSLMEDDSEDIGEQPDKKSDTMIYIEQLINELIKIKYKFIHYNGFPEVDKFDFSDKEGKDPLLEKKNKTENQEMVVSLYKKYRYNIENYSIKSPFRNEVIIIDEVHNFVREIMNGSDPAMVFYNWIVNAEDIKLIFLSGTPVINRPAEIAILYNMLRGSLLVFNFTIKSNDDEIIVEKELRDILYSEKSSIEQLHVSKRKGKLIVSITKNKTNFESIMEDGVIKTIKYNDHDLNDFFKEVFDGLYSKYDNKQIIPNREQLSELLKDGILIDNPKGGDKKIKRSISDIKMGESIIFDKETNIVFNRKQKLFEIYQQDKLIDLSNNENFVEYFFDDMFNIPNNKQVLLRRMLLGLTSHYPIDRSSIINMPVIVPPENILDIYEDYTIVKNINVVPCYMTSIQWVNYETEYTKDKLKRLNQMRKKDLYADQKSDFSIRTRQNSNIVFDDDTFRVEKDEQKKNETYQRMKENGHFSYDKTLRQYSPKFYQIMKNINKFVGEDDIPTGKALYYSDFRHESGSEAFEKILLENGYEKYDPNDKNIEELISEGSKKKRFTYITGKETQEDRRSNKEAFNIKENMYGEYIQLILISSAGAEGISLTCVRQVHIMEPFWNYIRVDQVFGRAIRMRSHLQLPEKERNVEQYLYISKLPEGNTVEDLFKTLKDSEWPEVKDIEYKENIKMNLIENHKPVYKTLTKILSMKKQTKDRTVDGILFDIMEKKNVISSKISSIIKESSVDCIQNTKDDIQLNEKCLRFSSKLSEEDSHFPGLTSGELNDIDKKQFTANFMYFIKPDIYVLLAVKVNKGWGSDNIFVYYKLDERKKDIDVRYIRENGVRLCDYYPKIKSYIFYEGKNHILNKKMGKEFSVFQTMYKIPEYIYDNKIKKSIFPSLNEIIIEDNLIGYIIKYNITSRLFYSPKSDTDIIKLYPHNKYVEKGYTINKLKPILILKNNKVFKFTN